MTGAYLPSHGPFGRCPHCGRKSVYQTESRMQMIGWSWRCRFLDCDFGFASNGSINAVVDALSKMKRCGDVPPHMHGDVIASGMVGYSGSGWLGGTGIASRDVDERNAALIRTAGVEMPSPAVCEHPRHVLTLDPLGQPMRCGCGRVTMTAYVRGPGGMSISIDVEKAAQRV